MSNATATPPLPAAATLVKPPPASLWTNHSLVQLTLVRFREFWREPEALFWVFVFPILLSAGLGIAFRNRPPEKLTIAAVTPELARSLRQETLLEVRQLSGAAAEIRDDESVRASYLGY